MSLYQTRELYVLLQLKLICFAFLELSRRALLCKIVRLTVNANAHSTFHLPFKIVQFFDQDNKARIGLIVSKVRKIGCTLCSR